MVDITVWGRRSSSNVQLVLWVLDEVGVPYRQQDAGYIYGVVDTPDFLAMNPNGRVPVLIDGDSGPIFESAAITRYLGARYGQPPFWPTKPVERAMVDKWAEWAKWNVGHAFIMTVFWNLVRTPADKVDHVAVHAALQAVEAMLAIADAQLATTAYLAGDDFTFADVMLGYALYRYYDIDVRRRRLPHLRRYYDQLCARPAYQAHVIYPYDELRA
jgi:glutathione S-transferase